MAVPPETDRDPVTDTLHGEEVVDPYRWLEGDDEAVADWERRQNEYTDTVVETERRDALRDCFEAVVDHADYFLPVRRGDRYFQRVEPAGADQPKLTVRSALDDDPETLVDPETDGANTSLEWFVPDRDGERVVCGVMESGTEQYDLVVVDGGDGTELDRIDGVGRCNPQTVAWDGEGFYYGASGEAGASGEDGEGGQLDKELRYYDCDSDGGSDRLVTDEIPAEQWPAVFVDDETDLVVVGLGELAADTDLYALVDGDLVPVLVDADAAFEPQVHAGRVYLLTNHEAPRFRVLAIDAEAFRDAGGIDDFAEVIPESADVLVDLAPAGVGVAVHRYALDRDERTSSVVSVHDPDGAERHELSLPPFSGIDRRNFAGNPDTGELFFLLYGFDRPTSVVRADVGSDATPDDYRIVQSPSLPAELDPREELDLTVDRIRVESAEGAEVPAYVVRRADLEPDGDAPTVLYGYGGFRIPQGPSLDPYRLPFLQDGGVYVVACLRGGLEFGEEWHAAGSGAKKENTFADFEAVAEALVDRGYTSADRLAAWGGSNGGLTVGAAMTRRPDLFGAVVCAVPLLDMLRFHRFLLGAAWTGEYGSPEDPEAFEWLHDYSPYHNVAETAYPATLFVTAAGDTRVHPAHARKMTARVQAATTGDDPICYRSYDEAGHGTGIATSLEIEQRLDRWTFVYEALGVGAAE